MATYDPVRLQRYADRLQRSAIIAIILWTLLGLEIGLGVGAVVFSANQPDGNLLPALGCALPGGLLGFLAGEARAFALKLRVQTLLCRLNLETNVALLVGQARSGSAKGLFEDAPPPPPPWETPGQP